MLRSRRPVSWLGVVLFVPSLCAPAAAQNIARIQADVVEVDFDGEQTHAAGNARLTYGDFEISADELTADRVTGHVAATGNLQLRQGERQLRGRTLEYNIRTEEGVLTEARAAEQGIIIRGERITFSPRELVAHHAHFTTCNRPDPHYSFGAERITLTAQETEYGGPPESGRLSLNRARVTYRGRTLFTLPDVSLMQVAASVNEVDLPRVKLGQKANVSIESLPHIKPKGTVEKIATLANRQHWWMPEVKEFDVDITIEGSEALKPGISARVEIIVDRLEDVIYVPLEAVFEREGQEVCYVAASEQFVARPVKTGKSNDDFVKIKEGLQPGEKIALFRPDEGKIKMSPIQEKGLENE